MNNTPPITGRRAFEVFGISRSSYEFKRFMNQFLSDKIFLKKENHEVPINFLKNISCPKKVYFKTHVGLPFSQKMDFLEAITYMKRKDFIKEDSEWNNFLEVIVNNNDKTKKPYMDDNRLAIDTDKIAIATERHRKISKASYSNLHLTVHSCEFTPAFHKFLKFAYYLSAFFFFHIKYENIDFFERGGYGILQSLFIISIRNALEMKDMSYRKKYGSTRISIIVHDVDPKEDINCHPRIAKMVSLAWKKAVEYLQPYINISDINIYNIFTQIECCLLMRVNTKKKYTQNTLEIFRKRWEKEERVGSLKKKIKLLEKYPESPINPEANKKIELIKRPALTKKNMNAFINKAFRKALFLDFFTTGRDVFPIRYWTKAFISKHFIEFLFDGVVLGLISIIKRWYAISDKRLYISNFGRLFRKIKHGILRIKGYAHEQLKIFQTRAKEGTYGNFYTEENTQMISDYAFRARLFLEHHTKRIWVLQMKKLQYNCSDFFEKKVLKILTNNPEEYDKAKDHILLETEKIFQKTVQGHDIPKLGKLIINAVLELRQVLNQYTEKCKEFPAAELRDINRISRNIRSKGIKQRSFAAGLGITASVRLRGFGNFHIITSYGLGPHILNFSCINDRDTIENDYKEKVSPFRIQPSVNFDIKI
ncbi:hypothetical protein CMESO_329 (nucleomorph) [Chroomonas mesostigmatica CCMP1168]|uniref:Uncharacterized protein n=1 Tax=Chroomonas mesostigmatica CCMP1168 TaxID=1195612 RepID=J7G605_9CRYP|nr:hypothetical protein CMESO_329 [Chroomonas mesostigmatica CCMP1168]|mmetsp:Transcript_7588/g.18982  ORF Transcript_7588/g.18982 Transcript_7588/m.18982 type:complete len:650 (+) Transcript_7588:167-2116(+)